MSTVYPVIPPIAPTEAEKAGAPEPDSERADRLKAAKMRRIEQEGAMPIPPDDERPAETIEREVEAARRRQDGE